MKLLLCDHCGDIFNLTRDPRACSCSRSAGRYRRDGWHAIIAGRARVIGIANSDIRATSGTYHRLTRDGQNQAVRAWVLAVDKPGARVEKVTWSNASTPYERSILDILNYPGDPR